MARLTGLAAMSFAAVLAATPVASQDFSFAVATVDESGNGMLYMAAYETMEACQASRVDALNPESKHPFSDFALAPNIEVTGCQNMKTGLSAGQALVMPIRVSDSNLLAEAK